MSEYTLANFGALQQGQSDFQQTYNNVVTEVQTLESQLQTNLSQWVGSAQQAYHEAQSQWNAAMANMQQVLQQLGTVIGTANDNYQTAEQTNANLWA
jgi:early secretory antigenic target protein ESAT-6